MIAKEKKLFYNPFEDMAFTYDRCFLCGGYLKDSKSNEHIFPKWSLKRYDLWDENLILLNGSRIKYRQLTIPCCRICNNKHLSKIEKKIGKIIKKGYDKFKKFDELIIYQWILKIFYGLLFKELSLNKDLRNPLLGTIISPEILEKFETLHFFLQSIRVKFEFKNFLPWSIFILKSHTYDNPKENFDYHDEIFNLTFSIRMGEICIFACLEDSGAQKELFEEYFEEYEYYPIHPLQFDELSAKITYKSSLMNRVPKYISFLPEDENGMVIVTTTPLQGFSTKPIYDDWDPKSYSKVLYLYWSRWGKEMEEIFIEPNLVLSFLKDEEDNIKKYDRDGNSIE